MILSYKLFKNEKSLKIFINLHDSVKMSFKFIENKLREIVATNFGVDVNDLCVKTTNGITFMVNTHPDLVNVSPASPLYHMKSMVYHYTNDMFVLGRIGTPETRIISSKAFSKAYLSSKFSGRPLTFKDAYGFDHELKSETVRVGHYLEGATLYITQDGISTNKVWNAVANTDIVPPAAIETITNIMSNFPEYLISNNLVIRATVCTKATAEVCKDCIDDSTIVEIDGFFDRSGNDVTHLVKMNIDNQASFCDNFGFVHLRKLFLNNPGNLRMPMTNEESSEVIRDMVLNEDEWAFNVYATSTAGKLMHYRVCSDAYMVRYWALKLGSNWMCHWTTKTVSGCRFVEHNRPILDYCLNQMGQDGLETLWKQIDPNDNKGQKIQLPVIMHGKVVAQGSIKTPEQIDTKNKLGKARSNARRARAKLRM
jgi:hypothetical protein